MEPIEHAEQLHRRRRLGRRGQAAEQRVDLLPAWMTDEGLQGAKRAGRREGEEIADGVVVEDRLENDDLSAQGFQHPDGAVAGGAHLGVDGGVTQGRGVGEADRDVRVVERGQPRRLGPGQGAQIGGIRSHGHVEGERHVGNGAGHGAVGREVYPAGWVRTAGRDAAEGRLHPR